MSFSYRFLFNFIILFFNQTSILISFEKISIFSGHRAVTRSLVSGLKRLNINFNLDPSIHEVGDVVVNLGQENIFWEACKWKKNDRINKLFCGPNIGLTSEKVLGILGSPELDGFFEPAQWVNQDLQRYAPCLKNKLFVWYAGVDEQFWSPGHKEKGKNVLVYWKTESESFCIDIEKTLRKHGWNPLRIKYGTYSPDQFKSQLNQSQFVVFISKSESQGIALAEAWSMNIPTIVWNPQVPIEYLGVRYKNVSSCPYLTSDTGIAWKNLGELEAILANISLILGTFKPREWVLKNMTDEVSAQMLIDIIIDSFNKKTN